MKRFMVWACLCALLTNAAMALSDTRTIKLKWLHTSDVHGELFGHDFLRRHDTDGGLGRVYAYVQQLRRTAGCPVILSDGGDVLQGQPTVYYANFERTDVPHVAAEAMNLLGYDVAALGNHDIEAGPTVYERWMKECRFPFVAANVIRTADGHPFVAPYVMLEREGVRIAVIGLLTPCIPHWLPERLWQGLRFEEMVESARRTVREVQERERPHVVVGLFHSGWEGGIVTPGCSENAVKQVAETVPGFDLIAYGHDHRAQAVTTFCADGGRVACMAPSADARQLCEADIEVTLSGDRVTAKRITPRLVPLNHVAGGEDRQAYDRHMAEWRRRTEEFVNRPIGTFVHSVDGREAYFGPSAFIDLIHSLQLHITGAQVSLAAPLSFDARIAGGTVTVADMFNLYKYENQLYTLRLTGREIVGALEMSYALWTARMRTPADPILLLDTADTRSGRARLKNPVFNFDSAAGLLYTVDVTKPEGQKITVTSLADGTPFCPDSVYTVAVNSYRGAGGGELLTRGAGLTQAQLAERVLHCTEKDLRYYLMEYIRAQKVIDAQPLHHWRFVPEEWAEPACERMRALF